MTMFKYIGIFILSASISAYGALKASTLKTELGARAEIILLLRSIERCIQYGGNSLESTIKNCPCHKLKKLGVLDELSNFESTSDLPENSLLFLSENDKKEFVSFFLTLGKSAKSEIELKKCRYLINYFESTQKDSEKNTETKANLYRKIGLITGIMAAIIFI